MDKKKHAHCHSGAVVCWGCGKPVHKECGRSWLRKPLCKGCWLARVLSEYRELRRVGLLPEAA